MLRDLYIENVAVIEKAELFLEDGLNVFTGETGAGKSILIGAVGAVLGSRTSKDIVRSGCEKTSITAYFDTLNEKTIDLLNELGYQSDDGLVLIRDIYKDGRNVCKINGKPANVSLLRQIGGVLLTTHGQHDNHYLLDENNHLDILDKVADLQADLDAYHTQFTKARALKKHLDEMVQQAQNREQQIDILSYQVKEITAVSPKPGEEEELEKRANLAKYNSQIAESITTAMSCLSGNEDASGAAQLLSQAAASLKQIGQYIPAIDNIADKLTGMGYEIEECALAVAGYDNSDSGEFYDINAIEERLDAISRLKRKYGETVEQVLDHMDDCKRKLLEIDSLDDDIDRIKIALKAELTAAKDMALKIRAKRKSAGERFAASVCEELKFLNMPSVTFTVLVEDENKLTAKGMDKVTFLISANPGEEAKSISRIASGGELSRIMLAVQNIIAEKDEIPTVIFDEIDTGVSGSAAHKIGKKLKEAADKHQVICVTHSAQLAAFADNHLLIKKSVNENRTFTTITPLDEEGRVRELARIISGDNITNLALENATEMMNLAKNA